MDGETYEEVESQLRKAHDEMVKITSGGGVSTNGPMTESKLDGVTFSNGAQSDVKLEPSDPKFGGFALVINGHSLVSVIFSCTVGRMGFAMYFM